MVRVDKLILKQNLVDKETLRDNFIENKKNIKNEISKIKVEKVCEKCVEINSSLVENGKILKNFENFRKSALVENKRILEENFRLKDRLNFMKSSTTKSDSNSNFQVVEITTAELDPSDLVPKNLLDLDSVENFNDQLNQDKLMKIEKYEKFLKEIFGKVFCEQKLKIYDDGVHEKLLRYI